MLPGEESSSGSRLRPRRRLQHTQCRDSGTLWLPLSDQTSATLPRHPETRAPTRGWTGALGPRLCQGPNHSFQWETLPEPPRKGKTYCTSGKHSKCSTRGHCLSRPVPVPAPHPLRRSLPGSLLCYAGPGASSHPLPSDDRSTWGPRCSGALPRGAEAGPHSPGPPCAPSTAPKSPAALLPCRQTSSLMPPEREEEGAARRGTRRDISLPSSRAALPAPQPHRQLGADHTRHTRGRGRPGSFPAPLDTGARLPQGAEGARRERRPEPPCLLVPVPRTAGRFAAWGTS